jgi:NDP-sugar pyrophosphorylase family protein
LRYLGDAFFVQYGDSYLPCDYRSIARAFERSSTLGLMTVYLNDNRWDASNVLFEHGRIVCYDKRHPTAGMRHIDYGLGALRAAAFDAYDPGAPLDLADVYRDLAARRELTGFEVPERFFEIGSVSGLAALRSHLDPINPQRRMRDDERERSSRQDLR